MWLCASAAHTGCVSACVWVSCRERVKGRQTKMFYGWKNLFINLWPNPFKSVFAVWVKTHYRFSQWWSNKKILQQWCNAHAKIAPTVISSVPLYPSVLAFIFFHFGHSSVWATVGQTLIVHQRHQERTSEFFYYECKYPRSSPKMADQHNNWCQRVTEETEVFLLCKRVSKHRGGQRSRGCLSQTRRQC